MKLKNFLPGIIFLLLAIFLVYMTDLEEKPNFYPSMVGKTVPKFTIDTLDGQYKVKQKEFNGKIINFWASWCVACKAEHDLLLNLRQKGYKLIGVNSGDQRERGLEYLKEYKNPFYTNLFDPKRTLAIAMGVTGMPETFVINKDGLIIYHFRGALTRNEIFNHLMPVLDELNEVAK